VIISTYKETVEQLMTLLDKGRLDISNLALASSVIHQNLGFLWTGFYLVNEGKLRLGPFQGPVACTSIEKGRGVCGKSWERAESIVVKDVNQFDDHIACSPLSKSEIALPVFDKKRNIIAILDIDSSVIADFDDSDKRHLEELTSIITRKIES
jgi:L-methionine (R)-S-oxide reductase